MCCSFALFGHVRQSSWQTRLRLMQSCASQPFDFTSLWIQDHGNVPDHTALLNAARYHAKSTSERVHITRCALHQFRDFSAVYDLSQPYHKNETADIVLDAQLRSRPSKDCPQYGALLLRVCSITCWLTISLQHALGQDVSRVCALHVVHQI